MIESILRPTYQRVLVDPLAKQLARTRLSPNHITLLAIVFGLLSALMLLLRLPVEAVAFLLLSGYCDTLDGTLARFESQPSQAGTILDIVGDRIVEFVVMFGLYSLDPLLRATPVMWMIGASFICVTSFLVVGIFTENKSEKSFYYSAGLIERPEAFAFYIAMICFPAWFTVMAWVYVLLVLVTAVNRVCQFLDVDWGDAE